MLICRNRACDVLLDYIETDHSARSNSIPIPKMSTDRISVAHLLGLKFKFFFDNTAFTPPSLYELTAFLLSCGVVTVQTTLPHLSPTLEDMASEYVSKRSCGVSLSSLVAEMA